MRQGARCWGRVVRAAWHGVEAWGRWLFLLREKRVEALLHVAHVDGERCAWEEEEEASRRWVRGG